MLKTRDAITTASHKQGSKFTAVLENDATDGKTVVPKGTVVYGTVVASRGGEVAGGPMLVVTFTALSVNNKVVAIVTDEAVGGAVALLAAKGNHIQIPAGTLVEVSLKEPVTIP
jgi:hypothetical protein